jgi:hypothetical protein
MTTSRRTLASCKQQHATSVGRQAKNKRC